ncbi:hypothetical protein [Sneathiella glossodoripedis]|uniref:hypothetical protein n=1 Tax=Sneathiella glossodoripedis TaxID=418853 RepID=UPI00046E6AFD|nr:hypothetical protein [Sneathiella glossodoripedis]
MSGLIISNHASTRMQQRGLRRSDLDLIFSCASEMCDGSYFLSRKDVRREINRRKREIQKLERLKGKRIVIANETVVTCYHSQQEDQKQMLRKERDTK